MCGNERRAARGIDPLAWPAQIKRVCDTPALIRRAISCVTRATAPPSDAPGGLDCARPTTHHCERRTHSDCALRCAYRGKHAAARTRHERARALPAVAVSQQRGVVDKHAPDVCAHALRPLLARRGHQSTARASERFGRELGCAQGRGRAH